MLFFLLLLFVFLPFPKLQRRGFHEDYLEKNSVLPIKGLFVLFVFFRHSREYFVYDGPLDSVFLYIDSHMIQLIVSMFLFYSGFGIYESIKIKGEEYISGFPKNRLLRIWSRFSICILLYYLFITVRGNHLTIKQVLLALSGWESIGNSNWFMFVTFSLYIGIAVVFRFASKIHSIKPLILFSLYTLFLIVALNILGKGEWWYNNIQSFVAGMWYSRCKEKINAFVQKSMTNYYGVILSLLLAFYLSYAGCAKVHADIFILTAPLFTLIVAVISMRIQLRSSMMGFLGKHVFSIYMLQRLSFMALSNATEITSLNIIICALTTICISVLFDYCVDWIEKRLYAPANVIKKTT